MAKKETQVAKKDVGGRPPADIDPQKVFDLAKIHCTDSEIAAVLRCAESTLKARFSALLREGREEGQMSLKRKMHEKALSGAGDTQMLIWLSKQRLGYKDKQPEEATQVHFNVFVNEVPK